VAQEVQALLGRHARFAPQNLLLYFFGGGGTSPPLEAGSCQLLRGPHITTAVCLTTALEAVRLWQRQDTAALTTRAAPNCNQALLLLLLASRACSVHGWTIRNCNIPVIALSLEAPAIM
jgi:hypothetical protein